MSAWLLGSEMNIGDRFSCCYRVASVLLPDWLVRTVLYPCGFRVAFVLLSCCFLAGWLVAFCFCAASVVPLYFLRVALGVLCFFTIVPVTHLILPTPLLAFSSSPLPLPNPHIL